MFATAAAPVRFGITRADAPPSAEEEGESILPYSGMLSELTGNAFADGFYDFSFALYSTETGGELVWSEEQSEVLVESGMFEVPLGCSSPIPEAVFGNPLWLAFAVRGPGENAFTTLLPRQSVTASQPVFSVIPAIDGACPHGHERFSEPVPGCGRVRHRLSARLLFRDQSKRG